MNAHLAEASPAWTDQLSAVSTFLGALGAVATLVLIYLQIRDQRVSVVEGVFERSLNEYRLCRERFSALTAHAFVDGDPSAKLLELRTFASTLRDLALRVPYFQRQLGRERVRILTVDLASDAEALSLLVEPVLDRMEERVEELRSAKTVAFAKAVALHVKNAPEVASEWMAYVEELRGAEWDAGRGLKSKQKLIARGEALGVDFSDLWRVDHDILIACAIRDCLKDVAVHLCKSKRTSV